VSRLSADFCSRGFGRVNKMCGLPRHAWYKDGFHTKHMNRKTTGL